MAHRIGSILIIWLTCTAAPILAAEADSLNDQQTPTAKPESITPVLTSILPGRVPNSSTPDEVASDDFPGEAAQSFAVCPEPGGDGAFVAARYLRLPTSCKPLGADQAEWTYGHAALLYIDATGEVRVLTAFAKGLLLATAVQADDEHLYLAGYAAPGMADLLRNLPGLQQQASWAQRDITTWCPPEHHSEPRRSRLVDQRGVPVVLRFDRNGKLLAGTFLEGWQSTWFVPGYLNENVIEYIHLGRAEDGDVIVSHDGGYNLLPADGERCSFEHFYAVQNHLSRLSPDLTERRWLTTWTSPHTDAAKVTKYQQNSQHFTMMHGTPRIDWQHDFLGNPRVMRMRIGPEDDILLCGWSPTRTSGEPWWSPFCLRLHGDGQERERFYCPDPMSGGKDRMDNLVSDAAVRSICFTPEGTLLAAVKGDGGNNIARNDPWHYQTYLPKTVWKSGLSGFSGRHLFWGAVTELDLQQRQVLRGRYFGQALPRRWRGRERMLQQDAWAVDLTRLADGRTVVIGRFRDRFASTPDAWEHSPEQTNRQAYHSFIEVFDEQWAISFRSVLHDFTPVVLEAVDERLWVVGKQRVDGRVRARILRIDCPLPPDPTVEAESQDTDTDAEPEAQPTAP